MGRKSKRSKQAQSRQRVGGTFRENTVSPSCIPHNANNLPDWATNEHDDADHIGISSDEEDHDDFNFEREEEDFGNAINSNSFNLAFLKNG